MLSGTIFSNTRVPLQKWSLAIALMVNVKKSISSSRLARDLDPTQQTALYMQQRIRAAMVEEGAGMFQGIVEADEAYVTGQPRHPKQRADRKRHLRGRSTRKTPIIGAVERGGKVVARMATDLTSKGVGRFLRQHMDPEGSFTPTPSRASGAS